jgi:hypothetical protein
MFRGGGDNVRTTTGSQEWPNGSTQPNGGQEAQPSGSVPSYSGLEARPSSSTLLNNMSEELLVQHLVLSSVPIKCKDYFSLPFHLPKCCVEPSRLSAMQVAGDGKEGTEPINADLLRLKQLKWEHNLAKAVKSDDAKVLIHIWDDAICSGKAMAQETQVIAWF